MNNMFIISTFGGRHTKRDQPPLAALLLALDHHSLALELARSSLSLSLSLVQLAR